MSRDMKRGAPFSSPSTSLASEGPCVVTCATKLVLGEPCRSGLNPWTDIYDHSVAHIALSLLTSHFPPHSSVASATDPS